jgi:Arc/MetJ-type ribon-helix-helix transcriptional regulator
MMTTIPIQIADAELSKIDYLIRIGRYKNRSQAIKSMLQDKLNTESILFEDENPEEEILRQKIVGELEKRNHEPIFLIKSEKNSAELISEDRNR